jgi:hypothetical protein
MASDPEERWARHSHLRALLERLPHSLPEWNGPDFRVFQADPEKAVDYGIIGAINRDLEVTFGYASRSTGDGIIKLQGRGPALIAIADVLIQYSQEVPEEAAILDKWTEDLILAASNALATANVSA